MADEQWQIALAVGVQSALGTVNATIAALSGTIDETDGVVLGDRESGDANSGIAVPDFERNARAVADVAGSFTQQFDSFQRLDVTGLSIAFALKGNGVTSTPSAGQAKPDPGIDALHLIAGLSGANGTSPIYEYTMNSGTTYGTIKLWIGSHSYVLQDCLVSNFKSVEEPGGITLCTAEIEVGSHDPATQFSDGVTFPTIDYGNQASLSSPTVQGVGNAFGSTRGFASLEITIANDTSEVPDSNQATGVRKVQDARRVEVVGSLYIDDGDSDYGYQNVGQSVAPTDDMTFQVGDIASATDTINAHKVELNNLQFEKQKPQKSGTATIEEFTGRCTATAAGAEFKLSYN